ncbi:MAG: TIGR03032 family protein [Planctomycetota bacterium]
MNASTLTGIPVGAAHGVSAPGFPPLPAETGSGLAVSCQCSTGFVDLLRRLRISLLVTSGRSGLLMALGVHDQQLSLTMLHQQQPAGVAAEAARIAVAVKGQVQIYSSPAAAFAGHLKRSPFAASQKLEFRVQRSHTTGTPGGPALAWGHDGLWVVNARWSCLTLLSDSGESLNRWKPAFISSIRDEDRCHLTGLAMHFGRPRYVTALSASDSPEGWRTEPYGSGVLIDVASGEVVIEGLVVPQSPRIHDNRLFLLQSWIGQLSVVDSGTGSVDSVESLPGYATGMDCSGDYAFVGLSRVCDADLSASGRRIVRDDLACGIAAVNLRTGRAEEALNFLTGIDQLSDLAVLPAWAPAML